MRLGESVPNKGFAVLALVTVILLVVALIVAMARRPTGGETDEGSQPAVDSAESEGYAQ
jgi:hypothetical protein